ncbi:HAD-IIIA family hydrolase [candidate division KSB1 bacterium]|nr:HAD-IIIA family hydrolase [candidate division KSB1 bacterium]
MDLNNKLCYIEMLLLDVDGVLTDGSIVVGSAGEMFKTFNAQDGFGIRMAIENGINVGIITGRQSEIVAFRARDLGISEVHQGYFNKLEPFADILLRLELTPGKIAYIGDDLFDMPLLQRVGFSVAVANARDEVKQHVDYVTQAKGGHGAVREVIDMILKAQHKWNDLLKTITDYDDQRMH